jgi:hypothetical protein
MITINLGLNDDIKYGTQHILIGSPMDIVGGRTRLGRQGWIRFAGWYGYYQYYQNLYFCYQEI